jgi:hypothetical protein
MMIKTFLLVLAISLVGCVTDAQTSDTTESTATITSKSDLDAYLKDEPASSPLRAFNPAARARFLDALTFSENGGVTTYEYADLSSVSDDAQNSLTQLFNIGGVSTKGGATKLRNEGDRKDMRCESRGTCTPSISKICTDNC